MSLMDSLMGRIHELQRDYVYTISILSLMGNIPEFICHEVVGSTWLGLLKLGLCLYSLMGRTLELQRAIYVYRV